MAKGSSEGDALHEMESGLIHTADSLVGHHGRFNSFFGEPGGPEGNTPIVKDKGIAGKTPHLGKKFQHDGQK